MIKIFTTCMRAYSIGNCVKSVFTKYRFLLPFLFIGIFVVAVILWNESEKKKTIELRNIQFSSIDGLILHTEDHHPEGFTSIKVGSNAYKVHEDLENPLEAAKTMDKLNFKATKLIDYLMNKYVHDQANLMTIKEDKRTIVRNGIKAMKKNFKTANMEENIPERSGGDTSYVIDKGEVFAMCLRDPKRNNKLQEDENDLTFVLIHEMAHLFTSTYGHDTLFWNNFRFLLQEAVGIHLYKPINYKKTGSPYCGIVVTYSPLYDKSLIDYRIQN